LFAVQERATCNDRKVYSQCQRRVPVKIEKATCSVIARSVSDEAIYL